MKSNLTISDVVKRTGLTAYTLRYYERIGLIAPVPRAAGGQRRYAASDMAWIEFLLRLRTTGMPVGKMQAFAKLRGAGDSTVAERRRMLEAHLADVLAEIASLRQSVAALQDKVDYYRTFEQSLAPDSLADEGEHDECQSPPTRKRKTARGR
ncbi:MerR family transcriptional regulator [Affinibrenneria salicis]|uniref:MerR family transcriptional regulator n=1 Tax=Affinibrenneria salicis TaxID=2590031 RepID=A0A5J5G1F4_9GAMM|nr:MerR family transcriptional regulator [Affinibrenneria salicis]KAA9000544.1 MerR family transcriptional regulator [Affinibrenneria salicis]